MQSVAEATASDEHWQQIHNIWVSSDGRVSEGTHGRSFVPNALSNGYRIVKRNGKQYAVHRLVAEAFLGPPPSESSTVDHINQDKLDNRLSNLRWADKTLQNSNRGKFRLAQNAVPIEVNLGTGTWIKFDSVVDAAQKLEMSTTCINHCLAGRNKSHKGATFRYSLVQDVLDGENWKENDVCFISDHGRVRSKCGADKLNVNHRPYFPKPSVNGYCYAFGRSVHRMVADAFLLPPADKKCTVDHVNRIRDCNSASNLRWATPIVQRSNSVHGAHDQNAHCRKVKSIDPSGTHSIFSSIAEASRRVGVKPQGIHKALRQGTKAAGRRWHRID